MNSSCNAHWMLKQGLPCPKTSKGEGGRCVAPCTVCWVAGPALFAHNALTFGARCLAGHLRQFTTRVTHILPVSDDGGSTAEIVRVLGGPAVGDIRSRCLRLADDTDAEVLALLVL